MIMRKVGFILSNFNRDQLLAAHLDILRFYPEPHEVIVCDMGGNFAEGPDYHLLRLESFGFAVSQLVALGRGLKLAAELGLEHVVYRPGDDWIFNHELVRNNFAAMPPPKFQAVNWFTTGSLDDFSITESYYAVPAFLAQRERFLNNALWEDRELALERKLARWARLACDLTTEFRRLPGRERTPPIGYPDGEMHLWFGVTGRPVPQGWRERRDPNNDRWSCREWQLIGNHDEAERRRHYAEIRGSVPYAAELEQAPRFRQWLERRV